MTSLHPIARTLLGGAILAFFCAASASANPFENEPVNSAFVTQGDHYGFVGDFTIDTDPTLIWQVLTDYGHIQDFVADFQVKILQRDENKLLLQQTLGEGFLFIRFDVHALLEVHEQPMDSIFVEDISHKEFARFQNVWILQPDPSGAGTKVTFMMDTVRNKHTPWYITPDVFRIGLRNFLKQYRYEIERRGAKAKKDYEYIPPPPDR
jgi:ribosome-associated toxin RatA of RatAB toxin-antitoxin module